MFVLIPYMLATIAKLIRPGEMRVVVAKSQRLKHQLWIFNRGRVRAPRFSCWDRLPLGFSTTAPTLPRIYKLAVIRKPATPLEFHKSLDCDEYYRGFASNFYPL
jgi:hypothetical protein